MKIFVIYALIAVALTACGKMTPERAAERCEERARAAAGPTGGVSLGVNSNSGGFANASIGVSADFLRGREPDAVYTDCMINLTGEVPTSRPALRN